MQHENNDAPHPVGVPLDDALRHGGATSRCFQPSDVATFPAPLQARWFDPVHGRYTPIKDPVHNKSATRLSPPDKGDWVLLLQMTAGK